MKAVIDTNILIDYLSGNEKAKRELDLYEQLHVSVVTWMETLVGAADPEEDALIRDFLRRFRVEQLDDKVAERAVMLRRQGKLRLPDAIIWATALELGALLVTRNTRDFPSGNPGIRVPYR